MPTNATNRASPRILERANFPNRAAREVPRKRILRQCWRADRDGSLCRKKAATGRPGNAGIVPATARKSTRPGTLRTIWPIQVKLSSGKWCKMKTPTSASPAQLGRFSSKSPGLQKIAPGSSAGLGARSKPVTVDRGNQREIFLHKRPSPAPISMKRIPREGNGMSFPAFSMAWCNARFTQRVLPIKALIASRSSLPRRAEGSSAGR